MTYRLLPEWHKQEAIILAWPDAQTDWAQWLDAAQFNYCEIIRHFNEAGQSVLVLIREHEIDNFKALLGECLSVLLVPANYNDTWVRDYGFLTLGDGRNMRTIEFQFNGWGNKFDARNDNAVNQRYLSALLRAPIASSALTCEGGALEIDREGTLLSTASCLLNPLRNGLTNVDSYAPVFKNELGAKHIIVFENGHLSGDDTDGHIDTLVRFTPFKGIVLQSCFNRENDEHFEALAKLKQEISEALPNHDLFELPLPCVKNEEGARLPASYANFLISNGHVFLPVYGEQEDELALQVVSQAFPGYRITPINCRTLVQQFGSLHCITMQVPEGIFKQEVTDKFNRGVCLL